MKRALWLLVFVTVTCVAAERPRARYVHKFIGRRVLATSAVGSAISHLRNQPREWGSGAAGFGKRFASSLGSHGIQAGIELGVAGIRHEQMSYQPMRRGPVGQRLRHALVGTVITRKTTTGRRTVAAGRISGALGSGLISRTWMPASAHSLASGFSTAGISLGADAGVHVAREFWPHRGPGRDSH